MTSSSPLPLLRVGVLIESTFLHPRWIRQIFEDIQNSDAARVVLVVRDCRSPGEKPAAVKELGGWRCLLYRLYEWFDERRHAQPDDPFQPVSLEDLLQGCETLDCKVPRVLRGFQFSAEDVERIRERGLDVFLYLGDGPVEGSSPRLARHGAWSLCHGDGVAYRGFPAGFWEVVESTPVTGSVLHRHSEDKGAPQVLYRSFASTDWLSPRRSKNNYFWKSSAFIIRKLNELRRDDARALETVRPPVGGKTGTLGAPAGPPGNLKMASLAVRLAGRYARNTVRRLLYQEEWCLAVSRRGGVSPASDLEYLLPPRDRSWADPFPVRWKDRYYVFMEEVPHETRKGYISVMSWKDDLPREAPVKVLEKSFHLSYPFLFRWANRWYLIPESVENSTVELYGCLTFPFEWRLEKVLIDGVKLFDVTLREIEGRWWMFASKAVRGASEWDELHLFYANTPMGPWHSHRGNPVKSDVRSARPAGALFERAGALYRPAQDCSRRYGYGVSINKVVKIDPEDYREVEVSKILPNSRKSILGIHTLNQAAGLTFLDCKRLRPRLW